MPTFSLTQRRALLTALGAVLVALAAARFLLPPSPAPAPAAPLPPPSAAPGPAPALVVHVVGAVRQPGLYRLAPGKRIFDAVTRAGGLTPRADAAQINLAAPLADGEQVVVPARTASAGARGSPSGGAPGTAGPVHLNTASVEELDALPGVGPVTAQKIVDYRTAHGAFTSVDELDAIPGIGPARLGDLRELVAP